MRQSLTQGEHRRRNCLLRAHTRKLSKASAPSGFLSRRSLMKRLLIIVSASAHSQSSYGRRRFQVRPVSMPLKFCYPFTAGVVSTAPPHYTPLYPTHVPLVKVSTLSLSPAHTHPTSLLLLLSIPRPHPYDRLVVQLGSTVRSPGDPSNPCAWLGSRACSWVGLTPAPAPDQRRFRRTLTSTVPSLTQPLPFTIPPTLSDSLPPTFPLPPHTALSSLTLSQVCVDQRLAVFVGIFVFVVVGFFLPPCCHRVLAGRFAYCHLHQSGPSWLSRIISFAYRLGLEKRDKSGFHSQVRGDTES